MIKAITLLTISLLLTLALVISGFSAVAEDTNLTDDHEHGDDVTGDHVDSPDDLHLTDLASGEINLGESWSYNFTEEGELSYHCHPHPNMVGTIIIDADDPAALSGEVDIDLRDFQISPDTITIVPGTTVTWTNYDEAYHTVDIGGTGHAHEDVHHDHDAGSSDADPAEAGGFLPFLPVWMVGLILTGSLLVVLYIRRR